MMGMQGFFSLDGPFYKFGTILADIMILSMIWLLFSIPIVTIGASTTALYYVMTRRISNREGYLFRDFWTSFKGNFKQTTIIWLIFWVLAYILYINITNIEIIGSMATIIKPIQICFCIELILIFMYIMPINARFQIGLKDSFKTAFFMANRHLPTSILCALIAFGVFLASWITIIMSLVAMGIYVYLTSFLFLRVFKKYRPEIDLD
ncbi:MAG: YesL family protein, partial [Clostridiales bacterium]|nr:YesL family protein [Clostridiales bacterium]